MFLISDKTIGYIAVGCAALILIICIVMAVISSMKKKQNNEKNLNVVDNNESEVKEKAETVENTNENATSEETLEEEETKEETDVENEAEAEETEQTLTKEENDEDELEEETLEEAESEEETKEEETEVEDEEAEQTLSEEENDEDELEEETLEEEETKEETDEEETESVKEERKEETDTKEAPVARTGRYAGKYVIMCENNQYRYQLFASNGQSLIISEGYTTERGCRNGILTVKKNITEGQVKIDSDKHDKYFFTLVSKQNRILCQSASYSTKESCISASESFKKFALTENVIFDENAKGVLSTSEKVDVEFEEKENGKYEIREDDHGYIYVLKASNNVEIVTSQDYSTYASCKEAMERFREVVYTGDFLIFKDKNNNFQFKLYNQNNRLVVAGEVYSSKAQVIQTITSIKSFAKLAQLEDPKAQEEE